MTLDDFLEKLAELDSNDAEIEGLKAALNAAVGHMTYQMMFALEKELPAILADAKATRY